MKHLFIVIGVSVFVALTVVACRQKPREKRPSPVLTLKLVHSPELRSYLSSMREQFYLSQPTLSNGLPIRIELISEMGVSAAKRLANGELKNHAWIAPSNSLVDFTNTSTVNLGAKQIDCLKLFETPVVLAIKAEQEMLLGVSTGHMLSWKKLVNSALSQRDESAPFLIGFSHAQPHASTTGLAGLIQLAYIINGKSDLSAADLRSVGTVSGLKAFESLVFSYPLSENYLLSNILLSTNKRVRLGITTEQQVVQYKRQHPEHANQLAVLYAQEGSYMQDYHLCSSAADWVTAAHQAALKVFYNFITGPLAQKAAQELGFRATLLKTSEPPAAESTPGINALSTLPPVSGQVVAGLLEMWPAIRRRAALILALDASGSMEGDALEAGKEQFRKLIAQSTAADLKSLQVFASNVHLLSAFTNDPARLISALDTVQAVGGSAVYDAIKKSYELASLPELTAYRKTILLYTDGDDKNSEISLASLLGLAHEKASEMDINLIIVAVKREGASFSDLERIAQAANGTLHIATLIEMESVFQEIAKSF